MEKTAEDAMQEMRDLIRQDRELRQGSEAALFYSLIDSVEELANRIPAPNKYAVQFLQLASAYRTILDARRSTKAPYHE